jgi:hypothetical protein
MKYPITSNREIDKTTEFENVCRGNTLIMMHGLPRSGKSTWAQSQGFPIVDPDAIRLAKTGKRWWGPIEHEVWALARTMVRALYLAGHKTVILDSTCYSRQQRDFFLPTGDVLWNRYSKEVYATVPDCCDRAIESGMPDLVDVIKWMAEAWEDIKPEERIAEWLW